MRNIYYIASMVLFIQIILWGIQRTEYGMGFRDYCSSTSRNNVQERGNQMSVEQVDPFVKRLQRESDVSPLFSVRIYVLRGYILARKAIIHGKHLPHTWKVGNWTALQKRFTYFYFLPISLLFLKHPPLVFSRVFWQLPVTNVREELSFSGWRKHPFLWETRSLALKDR